MMSGQAKLSFPVAFRFQNIKKLATVLWLLLAVKCTTDFEAPNFLKGLPVFFLIIHNICLR